MIRAYEARLNIDKEKPERYNSFMLQTGNKGKAKERLFSG